MRRIFSNPIAALAAGALLRFFLVLYYPAGSGDTVLYEQIASNWLTHHIYGMTLAGVVTPVDTRVPGYPAFLTALYWLTGKVGLEARFWVMSAQVFVDLATCFLIAAIAAVLVFLAFGSARPRRVFTAALWLAVLCPFTANYAAVLLTETWATFFTAVTILLLCLLLLRFRGSYFSLDSITLNLRLKPEGFGALAGFAAGLGTLFRPETPLILAVACLIIGWYLWQGNQWNRMFRIFALMALGCVLPLLPWAVRNAVTLHELQFLSPRNSTLPGELVPYGFMAWEKTWLYRLRDCYLVSWKLNDEAINLEDIPAKAFDTAQEKQRVADLLSPYNDDVNLTADEDQSFAQLARERTARHPLRTYLEIPALRAAVMWLTPRIELLPFSGKVFPLATAWEDDPVDQSFTIAFVFFNIIYLLGAAWGALRLWHHPSARVAVSLLIGFVLLRTAFLTTLEAPEPRYVLVCFPVILAFTAQIFSGPNAKIAATVEVAELTQSP